MQHDATSPEAYLASLPADWRRDTVLLLRQMLLGRGLVEEIGYGMLRFSDAEGPVFHLNAQKRHVGLYAGNWAAIDGGRGLLEGFDTGKGCLRLGKRSAARLSTLETLIDAALAWRDAGGEADC
jgi:uncharacterized protein YdhG (YjbR/CyaY superfamily)